MTHVQETRRRKSTPFYRRRFLVHVSCIYISGIGFVRYQIPAPIRTQIAYVLMCFLVVISLQITKSSSTSLSAIFIFDARNFHPDQTGTEYRRQKLESSQFLEHVSKVL